jgi:hypothetical protein
MNLSAPIANARLKRCVVLNCLPLPTRASSISLLVTDPDRDEVVGDEGADASCGNVLLASDR